MMIHVNIWKDTNEKTLLLWQKNSRKIFILSLAFNDYYQPKGKKEEIAIKEGDMQPF